MSYTALSHGGVARVSTMVVDAPLDMGGFGIKADLIEESTPAAGVNLPDGIKTSGIIESVLDDSVEYEDPLKADSFTLVASDRERAGFPTVTNSTGTTHVVIGAATVPAYYATGTVRVGGELELISTTLGHSLSLYVYVNTVFTAALQGATAVGAGYVSVHADIAAAAGDVVQVEFAGTTYASGTCKNVFLGCDDADIPLAATRNAVWP